jgi:hypothetical protein
MLYSQTVYMQRASVATWTIDMVRYGQLEHWAIDRNTRKLVLLIPTVPSLFIHLAILGTVHGASS